MLRAVLDTNVFVSGLKDSKTPPGQILQLWKKNKFLIQRTFVTEGKLEVDVLKDDPDDNMVLATALEGQASYLVTGNAKHFPSEEYQDVKIVTPQEFVNILNRKY